MIVTHYQNKTLYNTAFLFKAYRFIEEFAHLQAELKLGSLVQHISRCISLYFAIGKVTLQNQGMDVEQLAKAMTKEKFRQG